MSEWTDSGLLNTIMVQGAAKSVSLNDGNFCDTKMTRFALEKFVTCSARMFSWPIAKDWGSALKAILAILTLHKGTS